jgi:hypothetical protein
LPPGNSEGNVAGTGDDGESEQFLKALMEGVKKVLDNKKATAQERMTAVQAGVKLLAIRHRIMGDDTKGFFE